MKEPSDKSMQRDARWTVILSQVHSLKLGMITHTCWVLLVNEWLLLNIHICCWLIFWCWMIGWHTAFSAIFCFLVNASLADEQPHFLINRITFLGGCTLLKGEPGVSPAEGDPGEINRQVCKPVKGKKDWQGWWKLMSGRIRAFVEVSANIWVVLGEWYAKKGLKSCHH